MQSPVQVTGFRDDKKEQELKSIVLSLNLEASFPLQKLNYSENNSHELSAGIKCSFQVH